MKKNITKEILEILDLLKTHPANMMGESNPTYNTLRRYIEGFMVGLDISYKKELMKNITSFFIEKRKMDSFPLYWGGILEHMHKDKSDKELKELLIDSTKEYFIENPNWYK